VPDINSTVLLRINKRIDTVGHASHSHQHCLRAVTQAKAAGHGSAGIAYLHAARANGALALRATGGNQVLRPLQQLRRHALACREGKQRRVSRQPQCHDTRVRKCSLTGRGSPG
jgi:uncharacterized membrane protein